MAQKIQLNCARCRRMFWRRRADYDFQLRKKGPHPVFCSISCARRRELPEKEIVKSYLKGASLVEVAKGHGASSGTIRHVLQDAGISRRSRTAHLWTAKNPTKGKGHTAATKAKIRAATIRQFSDPAARRRVSEQMQRLLRSGKIRRVSKIEDVVALEFNRRRMAYRRHPTLFSQNRVRRCYPDFLLPQPFVVEVNGTFWHTDPRQYPNGPTCKTQENNLKAYERKKQILKDNGLGLLELWEIDIEHDVRHAVDQIAGAWG